MNHNRLLIGIIIGAIAGIACGWFAGPAMVGIGWLGDMFLDALKMTIVPLIIAAVISGIASMGDVLKIELIRIT